jgi:hypothetical protein
MLKKIATDTLGVLMLLGALAFGWLPGPGGLPLLLGGLGLLSINHEWARNVLKKVKDSGTSLYDMFFPDNKKLYLLYDFIGLAVFGIAVYVISLQTKSITQTLAIAACFVAFGLLLTNRRRLEKISTFVSRLTKKR